jgi:hypothetical protein
MSLGLDAATVALASIGGFSDGERETIVELLKGGHRRREPGHEGWTTPSPILIDRAFTWSEFDRWHAFFHTRGMFPARWDGLHVAPRSEAPVAVRLAYRQRKLDLLLEWLEMLMRQTSELGRYTKQGLRARIVRQEDGHRCPVCESFTAHEVSQGTDTIPPLHPGCRCVLMAVIPVRPYERNGTQARNRSHASS